jgi:hypothetical protein
MVDGRLKKNRPYGQFMQKVLEPGVLGACGGMPIDVRRLGALGSPALLLILDNGFSEYLTWLEEKPREAEDFDAAMGDFIKSGLWRSGP